MRLGAKDSRVASDIFSILQGRARACVTSAAINFSISYGLSFVLICPVASVAPARRAEI